MAQGFLHLIQGYGFVLIDLDLDLDIDIMDIDIDSGSLGLGFQEPGCQQPRATKAEAIGSLFN